ncbi:ribosomal RNA large subunit methyltransferase H [Betaproteobacteria bacterium]|nr:ribosomal RNA large subunit methyltransferase H [Betaproteobacteria bacterium]GHU02710.1 ribosomal RNA large subunit methyltransferase H [Betaproteobacteria bacterium]GHU08877.1 ribosomal RNA large subunit methyltransferase H [Betaproteobacteria bacterium]GHU20352.1 ribosomal RNA large subunit methyltransferase H [Betaproteobacteria bacterium]GHU25176.1 ribosomal RNA large subunit methyltransferase H [Betaproteobacteria bacterium]
MKLLIVAVGHKMPDWVVSGFDEFARRMPRELPLELIELKAESRTTGKPPAAMMEAEAGRIEAALPARCRRVVLDEHGADLTSMALAHRLENWRAGGEDVAFIVGGPDGLAPGLKKSAHERLRLSSLTLPHALVRPLLAEALYRAWSIICHHPYHRE